MGLKSFFDPRKFEKNQTLINLKKPETFRTLMQKNIDSLRKPRKVVPLVDNLIEK